MSKTPSEDDLSPTMKALTERQRAFVDHYVETGGMKPLASAKAAGYAEGEGTSSSALAVATHRLVHNTRVMAAVKEEADRRLRMGVVLGASIVMQIAADPMHKDQYKAAVRLLDHAGLLIEHKQVIEVTHNISEKEKIEEVKLLAQQLGLDPMKLLGHAGVVTDAEFVPVVKDTWED